MGVRLAQPLLRQATLMTFCDDDVWVMPPTYTCDFTYGRARRAWVKVSGAEIGSAYWHASSAMVHIAACGGMESYQQVVEDMLWRADRMLSRGE